MAKPTKPIEYALNLFHAHFFFIDIVGLSDSRYSTKLQTKKIETLNSSIKECKAFKQTKGENMLVLPTGDGMAIGFFQSSVVPLNLAIELHKKLAIYNRGRLPSEIVKVRIGIHSGTVFVVNDVLDNRNIWGPGLILARRVMDLGDDGHILLSAKTAEELLELSDTFKTIIRPVHDFTLKHGQSILIYSAFGKGFGNPIPPQTGGLQKSKMKSEIKKLQRTTIYPLIKVSLDLIDRKKMKVHYSRMYQLRNISDEPIHTVLHAIATDTKKSFADLNIQVYDEEKKPLRIYSISVDKPYQKEFTTLFNRPINKYEKDRYFVLEYEVEEPYRYFENAFLINCERFEINFSYPRSINNPRVYDLDMENESKKLVSPQPTIVRHGKKVKAMWMRKNVSQGQSFRFEW